MKKKKIGPLLDWPMYKAGPVWFVLFSVGHDLLSDPFTREESNDSDVEFTVNWNSDYNSRSRNISIIYAYYRSGS